MNDTNQQRGTCLIDRCPRDPRHGTVCGPCRRRICDQLDELGDLWALLPDELVTSRGTVHAEALDLMTPVPSVHSRRLAAGTVADSRLPRYRTTIRVIADPGTGVVLGRIWDRAPVLLPDGSQDTTPAGDQHGAVPLTIWLDQWVLAWRDQRGAERLPVPTVDRLTGWLRARVDWACDVAGTAVDDLAAELGEQVAMLRRVTHMAPVLLPVPCPSCRERLTLARWPHSRYDECYRCHTLVTRIEYDRHLDVEVQAMVREGAA